MAETTPQQQQYSEYPNLNPHTSSNGNGSASVEQAKNSIVTNAQQTMDNIKNSQTVQSIANGPVAEQARLEADATKNDFGNLAASRQVPQTQTANGQNLTHYHSFFYNLLSWEHPRATAISYVSIVALIFIVRYVPVAKYALKAAYIVLGITAAAELAGKVVLGEGISSKMRPRKYYTIPHETLESILGDLEELANFFVIEFQRVVFAENVYATVAAFFSTLLTYFLIKIMPSWGLALFFTTVLYFVPLGYISNKEFVDQHLNNAQTIVSEQASQVRGLAAQHTNKALEASQAAFKDYSAKASELVSQGKQAAVDKGVISQETADKSVRKSEDFPSAPQVDPASHNPVLATEPEVEPLAA